MNLPVIPPGFWDRYSAEFRPIRPPVALGTAGGLSGSDFWRVESPVGLLMVKVWPADGAGSARVDQVHAWLARLQHLPWIAVPLADRQGRTVQVIEGRFWELTRFLPGTADLDRPPAPAHLAAMFAALAQIHQALAATRTRGFSPGLHAREAELRQLVEREFDSFQRVLPSAPADDKRNLALRWLGLASESARRLLGPAHFGRFASAIQDLQPVLRDVRPDHFLFEADQLAGLVDFGAMGVDSIATDLARLLGEAVGRSSAARRTALAAYESVRLIAPADQALIPVFESANAVLAGARWVRWHFIEGRVFRDPDAVTSGLTRALVKLAESNQINR